MPAWMWFSICAKPRATWTRRLSFRSLPMLDSLLRPVRAQGPSGIRGSLTGTVYLLFPFVRETTGRTEYDAQKFIKSLFSNTDYPPLAVRHLDCHSHGSTPITPLFCTTCTLSTSAQCWLHAALRLNTFPTRPNPCVVFLAGHRALARWTCVGSPRAVFPLAEPSRGRTPCRPWRFAPLRRERPHPRQSSCR